MEILIQSSRKTNVERSSNDQSTEKSGSQARTEIFKSYDFERGHRLKLLAELMLASPDKPVRKLLWEALKYYPVASKEIIRHWMRMDTAFEAAKIANNQLIDEVQHEQ